MRKFLLLFLFVGFKASAGQDKVYIEFLWRPIAAGSLARQPTIGFLLGGKENHQVCVAVFNSADPPPYRLRIDVLNQRGELISSRADEHFMGDKKCYPAISGGLAALPGVWTYKVYLNGRYVDENQIEVARNIEKAGFYSNPKVPYVLGRPNYDNSIPPSQWVGRLVWDIHANAAGRVTKVEVKVAEGVGEKIKDRAIAAGFMSLFPPDPSLGSGEFVYERELKFARDQ
ncbi:hypothetical protein [Xanthomonas sacchari]|uniref:hypothetical protein n=1 Tax=Xanthomonas sacchari TaxID=56458 RepID=UPI0012E0613D|nr:hypothetical protein [Xanthomonas sacchari]